MNIENLPIIQPKNFGNVEDPMRPILSFRFEVEGPHRVSMHAHPRSQIVYPISGVYRVVTPTSNWLIPPGQASWIPPHVEHEVFSNHGAAALLLFVDEAYSMSLPQECLVLNVSALLHELFNKAILNGNQYESRGKQRRIVDVMLDELSEMQAAELSLPMAKDKRVRLIMDKLLANPADTRNLEQLSKLAGASERTIARQFNKEVGMTFAEWRSQLRLLEAIEQLEQKKPVTQIAMDLGYHSPSAFIAMFNRKLGVPPKQYLQ